MGIQVTNLRKDERTFTFTLGDDAAEITYRPSGVTPKSLARVREAGEDEGEKAVVNLLLDVLVRWDIMDGDDMWPITEDRLGDLPLTFLADVLDGIQTDMVGEAGKTSAGG